MTDTDNILFLDRFRHTVLQLLDKEELSIDVLCDQLNMSRSQVHRKVKKLTGNSTTIHVRNIKLNKAKKLLRNSDLTIAEIAYACGIQSPQNMSKYFLVANGKTPSQFRSEFKTSQNEASNDDLSPANVLEKIDQQKSVAVFAFQDVGDNPEQAFLGAGIAEEILNGLMKLDTIRAVSCTSALYNDKQQHNLQDLGEELNVEYCLIGSIRKDKNELRVIVQLMDVSEGFVIWTHRFEKSIEDIFLIQEKIVKLILSQLEVTLVAKEPNALVIQPKTNNVEAYQYYLKGKHEFELRRDLDLSISYYEKAISVDKDFAHAYFGIAFALIYKCIFKGAQPKHMLQSIEDAYEAAILINNKIPETHVIKAWIYFYFYNDIPRAIERMQKAIVMDDKLMDAHRILAYFYTFSGRYEEGIPYAQVAFDLDSNGFNAWFSLADIYRRARKYEEAETLFESLLLQYPNIPIVNELLGLVYFHGGKIDRAEELLIVPNDYPTAIGLWDLAPYFLQYHLGHIEVLSDLLKYLTAQSKHQYIQPTILALLSFHLDKSEDAIGYMEDAKRNLDFGLNHIVSEPYWDLFRDHSTVQEALRVIGMA